jgi:protein gp37
LRWKKPQTIFVNSMSDLFHKDVALTLRIGDLEGTGARIKFLSLEPLLGRLAGLNLRGIDWVIVRGESGHRARPIDPEWVIRSFFFQFEGR